METSLAELEPARPSRHDHTRREVPRGPAPPTRRVLAGLVDLTAHILPVLLGLQVLRALADENGGGQADRVVFGGVLAGAISWWWIVNLGVSRGRRGASVGQRWCGLVVRDRASRGPIGARRSLIRQLARTVDLVTVVGTLRPLWRVDRATLADTWCRTEVVWRTTAVDEGFTPFTIQRSPAAIRRRRIAALAALLLLLVVTVLASVAIGARPMSIAQIGHALLPPSALSWTDVQTLVSHPVTGWSAAWTHLVDAYTVAPTDTDIIVRDQRLPRVLVGLSVGAALGVSGSLIQGHTRNPLADPGILGVSEGAACAVVVAIYALGLTRPTDYVWFAFVGALLATALVFGLSSIGGGGSAPLSLVLGGCALGAFLSSVTSAIVLADRATLDAYRHWIVGSVAGRGLDVWLPMAPFLGLGLLIALVSAPSLNLLALGEDVARGLGSTVWVQRVVGVVGITVLAGTATAICGPIAFLGLMVPHLARIVMGPDYRWLIPASALIGALVLVACDVIGRVVIRPGELQVGLVLAVVGAPCFIALVRRRKLVSL